MKTWQIDTLINRIAHCVGTHEKVPGAYARWISGDLSVNPYGTADAANILYTIGAFPREQAERDGFVAALRAMQDRDTGLFSEPTHHTLHTTAHCTAALELFDASPLYPCTALIPYTKKEGLYHLLEKEMDWSHPWPQSHKGAGIFVALVNTGMVDLNWKNDYFDWLWEHSDPATGFFLSAGGEDAPLFERMAGGFHFLFNMESEHRPIRYPEKMIDSCIELIQTHTPPFLCCHCGFIEIDVVYCLSRALRQCHHHFDEAMDTLDKFADEYLTFMTAIDPAHDASFNDLHMLFGSVCCLAELQSVLPGKLMSSKPLKLVLDRRPFI